MFGFLLWATLGSVVGAMVGVYRCSDITKVLPESAHNLHVGFCTGVGAIAGFLLFLLSSLIYVVKFSPG